MAPNIIIANCGNLQKCSLGTPHGLQQSIDCIYVHTELIKKFIPDIYHNIQNHTFELLS